MEPKDPIVLDAEGHVLHDPKRETNAHRKAEFRVIHLNKLGFLPKILLGGAFVALLFVGLTVAGIALGVLLMTFLARSIFKPKR